MLRASRRSPSDVVSADRAFFLSIRALADAYATHRLSPVEVTTAVLRRIERLNPSLNAFAQVTSERALGEARAAEQEIMRGRARGLLHGVPVAAKDLFQVRGTVTTAGSLIYGGRRANTDATAVARLEQAGAVLVGTTHLHELALGVTGVNPHFGPSRNPWDLDRMSGGSSGCE